MRDILLLLWLFFAEILYICVCDPHASLYSHWNLFGMICRLDSIRHNERTSPFFFAVCTLRTGWATIGMQIDRLCTNWASYIYMIRCNCA